MLTKLLVFREDRRGDTIVEVLIAIAIASVVLAGAYSITTQNLKTVQDTNERSQAQQLVEQQIELMRPYIGSSSSATITPNNCLIIGDSSDSATGGVRQVSGSNCQMQGGGGASCTASYCYTVSITMPTSGSGVYEVTVTWPNQHGTTSSVALDYGPNP